jgi:hypothetical protein
MEFGVDAGQGIAFPCVWKHTGTPQHSAVLFTALHAPGISSLLDFYPVLVLVGLAFADGWL